MRRQLGDQMHARKLRRHFESQDDLYTQCPKCGEHLEGTFQELMAHDCREANHGVS